MGDGGCFELETARDIGVYAVQARWYFKEGVYYPFFSKIGFFRAELPMDVVSEFQKINKLLK